MGSLEEDYTEERLAEYDRIAIKYDDVLVMGFVSVVRDLRVQLRDERAFMKLVVQRIRCGCWSLDCLRHGAFDTADHGRLDAIMGGPPVSPGRDGTTERK